jgi:outer membrane protein assembly factor BamB
MRIAMPRIQPDLARFLAATCRGVAVIAGLFCVAVTTLLVANYIQVLTLKPTDNPALTDLRERYRSGPGDEALADQIRQMDLAARRFYFTRQWQTRVAGYFLVAGVAVLLGCFEAAGALTRSIPAPPSQKEDREMRDAPRARKAFLAAGLGLLAAGLVSALLGGRLVGPDTGATEPASAAPATGAAAAAPLPAASEAFADNWPQFRGPGGNGVLPAGNPPTDWDGASSRNVRWKAEVPLPGRGSPAVWDDRVFLSGADKSHREVFCWNAATGALLWRQPVALKTPPPGVADTTGYAPSSVAVNGHQVFAAFADGDLAAMDLTGKILWTRSLGPIEMNYGYASSPAVAAGMLVVQLDQLEGGRLLCLDPETGTTRWETSREVTSCWASPVLMETPRGTVILANGNPVLAAYDGAKGKKLWETGGMRGENAPSPAYADGRVFVSNQLLSLTAVNAKNGAKLWEVYDDFPDVASPLAVPGGLLFAAASYGVLSCLDAATGKPFWKQEYHAAFYASPVLAGGRVYCLDRSGLMRIFAAERQMKLIASPALGEPTEATPAFHGDAIFIRGEKHLFCVGGSSGS